MNKSLYLVDTCSFIRQLHQPTAAFVIDGLIESGQMVMSAIVAMELYAGSKDKQSKKELDTLVSSLDAAGLLATPTFRDYQQAGILLENYSRRRGHAEASSHFRDILISLSALRLGACVVSENTRDFVRWRHELKRSFERQLKVQSLDELIH